MNADTAHGRVRSAFASLADALAADGQLDRAVEAIGDAIESEGTEPSDTDLLERLSELHLRRGDRGGAYSAYLRVVEIAPSAAPEVARRALALLQDDRSLAQKRSLPPDTWRSVIGDLADANDRFDVADLAVEAALERGDSPTAIDLLQRVVDADPGNSTATLRLARLRLDHDVGVGEVDRLLQAVAANDPVARLDADDQVTYRTLRAEMALTNQDVDAVKELLAGFDTARDEQLLADAHLVSGDTESAIDHARRATELDPTDLAARLVFAQSLCAAGRWDEAEQEAARANRLNPVAAGPVLVEAQIALERAADLATVVRLVDQADHMAASASSERVLQRAESPRPRSTVFRRLVEVRSNPGALHDDWQRLRAEVERTDGPDRGRAHLIVDHILAERMARSGELEDAERAFLAVVDEFLTHGASRSAVASLEVAIELDPKRAIYRWRLVDLYARPTDADSPTVHLERAAELWDRSVIEVGIPSNQHAWAILIRGWIAIQLAGAASDGAVVQRWRAAACYESAAVVAEESPFILGYLASAHRLLGLSRLAEDTIETAEWSPDHPAFLLTERAATLAEADRPDEARAALRAFRDALGADADTDEFADSIAIFLDYVTASEPLTPEIEQRQGTWGRAIRASSLLTHGRIEEGRDLYRSILVDDADPTDRPFTVPAHFVNGDQEAVLETIELLRSHRQVWYPEGSIREAVAAMLTTSDREAVRSAMPGVYRLHYADELIAEIDALATNADEHDREALDWVGGQLRRRREAIEEAYERRRTGTTSAADRPNRAARFGDIVRHAANGLLDRIDSRALDFLRRPDVALDPDVDIAALVAAADEPDGQWALVAGQLARARRAIRADDWPGANDQLAQVDADDPVLGAIVVGARQRLVERTIDPLVRSMQDGRRDEVDRIFASLNDVEVSGPLRQQVDALWSLHLFATNEADEARRVMDALDLDNATIGRHWAATMNDPSDWQLIERYLTSSIPDDAADAHREIRVAILDQLTELAGLSGPIDLTMPRILGLDLDDDVIPDDIDTESWPLFSRHVTELRDRLRERRGFELPGVRAMSVTDLAGCAVVLNDLSGPVVPLRAGRTYVVGPGVIDLHGGDREDDADGVVAPPELITDVLTGQPAAWLDEPLPDLVDCEVVGDSDAVAVRALDAAIRGRLGELLAMEIVAGTAAEVVGASSTDRTLTADMVVSITDLARHQLDHGDGPVDVAELTRRQLGEVDVGPGTTSGVGSD